MILFIIIALAIILIIYLLWTRHNMKYVISRYKYASTVTFGLRGRGKDILVANVIARRKEDYISNLDYKVKKGHQLSLDFKKLDIQNNYQDFINGSIKKYIYPYPENLDIYISDCGVYLPCQYNDKLNREYGNFVPYLALSRHLGNNNVHYNTQALNRVWDKLREQTDQYIYCRSCKVLFKKLVIQKIRFYEKYESAMALDLPIPKPLGLKTDKNALIQWRIDNNKKGLIKSMTLIYINKSNYDTRFFKKLLEQE